MTRFILIRHGKTNWSREKKYQGRSDIALSPEGKKNVRALAQIIKNLDIDVLYTSSLKRARQSGDIISAKLGFKARVDSKLNELNFGQWEGKTAQQLISEKNKRFASWARGKWQTPDGGESIHSLRRRVRQFLKQCLRKHKDQNIGIVTHGGPIRMIIVESLRLPLKHLFSFRADPASFTVLLFSSLKSAQLVCLNASSKIKYRELCK